MKVYAINESEVATISALNSQSTIFFSMASFFASSAIGIYTNAMFASENTVLSQVAKYYIGPSLIMVSVAFAVMALLNLRRRNQVWSGIREESENP